MANRHGLIAGATGTGKTVSLRTLAEQFSAIGTPVFMADVKGDLSGLPFPGGENPKVKERIQKFGSAGLRLSGVPGGFLGCLRRAGPSGAHHRFRNGPLLFSRILMLNDIQSGVLTLVFKIADDNGLLLLDLKDLRSMLQFVGDQADQFKTQYGNISPASVGAIQRNLLTLEQQGGDKFFGEPALNLQDLMQTDSKGNGVVNILASDRLMQSPKLYATFLLWMLAELFETLPEVGDPEKPKLVFFFDEAHLLFDDAPKILVDKIEQVVRLIRSKGVGVYSSPRTLWISRKPCLDNWGTGFSTRSGHLLQGPEECEGGRRYFPSQSQAERGQSHHRSWRWGKPWFRSWMKRARPPRWNALIFSLPQPADPLAPDERSKIVRESTIYGHYEKTVDRESAYEKLKARTEQKEAEAISVQKERPLPPFPNRRSDFGRGQERRPCHRQPDRPADHSGSFGIDFRRQKEINSLFTLFPGSFMIGSPLRVSQNFISKEGFYETDYVGSRNRGFDRFFRSGRRPQELPGDGSCSGI